jgi:hypothetical protein
MRSAAVDHKLYQSMPGDADTGPAGPGGSDAAVVNLGQALLISGQLAGLSGTASLEEKQGIWLCRTRIEGPAVMAGAPFPVAMV